MRARGRRLLRARKRGPSCIDRRRVASPKRHRGHLPVSRRGSDATDRLSTLASPVVCLDALRGHPATDRRQAFSHAAKRENSARVVACPARRPSRIEEPRRRREPAWARGGGSPGRRRARTRVASNRPACRFGRPPVEPEPPACRGNRAVHAALREARRPRRPTGTRAADVAGRGAGVVVIRVSPAAVIRQSIRRRGVASSGTAA
jgi:hypothetical protein